MTPFCKNETPARFLKGPVHYSWIILLITFFTLLISAGIRSTPGVLIVPWEQYFGWNRTVITFALAINLILFGLCGPFLAALAELYGLKRVMLSALSLLALGTCLSAWMKTPFQMTLLWGMVVGLGTGFTSQVLGSLVATGWFVKYRGLAVGIFSASSATGQLVFLPLFSRLVGGHGWQIVVLITALAALGIALLNLIFMRNRPADLGLLPYGGADALEQVPATKENPFARSWKGLKIGIHAQDFWLLAGSFFVCGASANGLIGTHFISACLDRGINQVSAAGMLSLMGIFDILGTVLSGWLSDRFDNRWLLFWYYGLRGLSLLLLPFVLGSSFLGLAIFIVFYGLDWVATVPPTVRLCRDIFGKESGIVFGWIFAAHQLGAAAATFGSGALYTFLGSYQVAFITGGVLCLTAAGLAVKIGGKRIKAAL